MLTYQNYHRHSFWSNKCISDSVVSNEDYAKRAVELGHGIISTLEHGWQGRYIEGYELAQKYGLKFVFGAEAYWVKDRAEKDRSNCHICLFARNENGRRAINDILSEACLTGFYGQPRIDISLLLSLPAEDVIVTTACVAFWKYEDVKDIVLELWQHFGRNFYLEVQYHNTQKQREVNTLIVELSKQYGIPLIMGCDSHYITENQATERVDFITSKGITYNDDEDGWYMDYPNGDTAYRRFADQCVLDHEMILEAINNTNIFLSVEDYDCPCFNHEIKMPTLYPNLSQSEKDKLYDDLVWKSWENEKKFIDPANWSKYESEIKKEIDIVHQTFHADYFLLDYEIVKLGKEKGGVITATGRGSGVGFYTNKLLGFTDIDRIEAKVKMYPERFMSPTRILQTKSLADLDMNLANAEKFAEAQSELLGEGHSYPMIVYGTMKPKAAWKMYAKSQNIDFAIANAVSEQIDRYENALKHSDDDDEDTVDIFSYIAPQFYDTYEKSRQYQGVVVSASIHPCSHLLYQGDIRREIGLVRAKDTVVCAMDGKWAEEYKFLKNDLLTVKVVDLINKTYEEIGIERHSIRELLELCPPKSEVWDIYKKGCTLGINQVEGDGTRHRVMQYAPKNISELCAFIAAIRPGFASMYSTFESRKPFSYGIKSLDELIQTEEMPNSFILYQEMSMAVLHYAGIPLNECYEIIKNIAKKRIDKVLKYKEQFTDNFEAALINEGYAATAANITEKVWRILEDSSRYSFNSCVAAETRIRRNDSVSKTVGQMYCEKGFVPFGKALSLFGDSLIKENEIVDIRQAGVQKLYNVITSSGASVICTMSHKFPLPDGTVKPLVDLKVGDEVFVMQNSLCHTCGKASPIVDIIEQIEYEREDMTYDIEMKAPAHNFVTETGMVVSNSHAYSVALDSLYGAYLKSNYPYEFYKVLLTIYNEQSKKDKIVKAKEEAENYFGIKFPPYRFGQDNRGIVSDKLNGRITLPLSSIKGFGSIVGEIMYEASQETYSSFVELLKYLDGKSIKSAKIEPLIKVGYFNDFGNVPTLLKILAAFDFFKQGKSKRINKEKVGEYASIISQFASGTNSKGVELESWTISDCMSLLKEYEKLVIEENLPDWTYRQKAAIQIELLGYVDLTTGRNEDRPKLLITALYPLADKNTGSVWGYKFSAKSIGSGKSSSITVYQKVFQSDPFKRGDIIFAKSVKKNNKGYWMLHDFDVVQQIA